MLTNIAPRPKNKSTLAPMVAAVFCGALVTASIQAQAEDGVTDTKIVLGESKPISGSAAPRAKEIRQGALLYFDKVNGSGGIHGRKIEFVTQDDGYEPERTAANTRKLIEENKVFALFGYFGTPSLNAALPIAERNNVPVLFPSTGAESVRIPVRPNVFILDPSYFLEAEKSIEYLIKKKGIRDIGLVIQDDAFGTAARSAVQKALAEHGLKLKGEGKYARNSNDTSAAVKEIIAANPKAVLIFTVGKAGSNFIKEANAQGFHPTYFVSRYGATSTFSSEIAGAKSEIYLSQSLPPLTESTNALVRDYIKDVTAAGLKPNLGGIEGYASAMITTEGLKAAGKSLTRKSLLSAFEGMSKTNIGGLAVPMSPTDHVAFDDIYILKVEGDKIVPIKE